MNKKLFSLPAFLFAAAVITAAPAKAQNMLPSINYDNLSFVEEPLAFSFGTFTFNTTALADQAVGYDFEDRNEFYNSRANFLTRVETQLPNTVRIAAQYFGSYDRLAADRYTDNIAFSAIDQWGTISGGNVTQAVREETRRRRGIGNSNLLFDDFYGGLDETGGFYSVRNNAYTYALTADMEGRVETGFSYSRPIGQSVYAGSLRLRKGDLGERPVIRGDGETYGAAIVGAYAYSNWLLDGQLGYEYLDTDFLDGNNRYFASAGAQIKLALLSLSAEGHIGYLDDEFIQAYALGARYDIARGASLNFGYNYADYDPRRLNQVLLSIRYDF
jgi:hypothetical protein